MQRNEGLIAIEKSCFLILSEGGHEIIEVEGAKEDVNFPVPASLKH